MARIHYEVMDGLQRLADAASGLDIGIAEVIVFHLAIEREVSLVVEHLVPYPEHIRTLSHANKLNVLKACWKGAPEAGRLLGHVLDRFNELRNALAHGDAPGLIEAAKGRLRKAFADLVPGEDRETLPIAAIAAGVVGFLADRPAPDPRTLYALVAELAEQDLARPERKDQAETTAFPDSNGTQK